MSTLKLATLSNQNGTASVSSDIVINGSAKAWVNFNGTGTPAIRASFNVSSITDNGTGDYTVNFTNALTDANYAAIGSAGNGVSGATNLWSAQTTPTTTAIRIATGDAAGANIDYAYIYVSVFR